MNNADREYVSLGFIDVFKEIGLEMDYVPLDNVNTMRDYTGQIKPIYLDNQKVKINAVFEYSKAEDVEISGEYRVDAKIKIVLKQLTDAGVTPQFKDAIDAPSITGENERYVVIGFDKRVEMNDIFVRLLVSKYDRVYSE
jgi:hypothetical protein